LGYGGQRRM